MKCREETFHPASGKAPIVVLVVVLVVVLGCDFFFSFFLTFIAACESIRSDHHGHIMTDCSEAKRIAISCFCFGSQHISIQGNAGTHTRTYARTADTRHKHTQTTRTLPRGVSVLKTDFPLPINSKRACIASLLFLLGWFLLHVQTGLDWLSVVGRPTSQLCISRVWCA